MRRFFFCFIIVYSTIPDHDTSIYMSMSCPRAVKLNPARKVKTKEI